MSICLTAIGPATASIDLSHLTNGVYDFELNNGALKNVGKLIITDTETTLEFITQNHFVKAFIFQIEGHEEEKVMEAIISIATSYFDEMYINIETYKGQQINNWNKKS